MHDAALDPRQHVAEAFQVKQPGGGIGPGGAQQHVIGLMFAQDIVDQVGREQHLATAFLLAGKTPRDQARYDRAGTESAFHQRRFRKPRLKIVTQHIRIE